MILLVPLALAAEPNPYGDPVWGALHRIALESDRNLWFWYADDPCGGQDSARGTEPEPGHPLSADMGTRRALAVASSPDDLAKTWNASAGRRLRLDEVDHTRIVVTLLGLDETCIEEVDVDPALRNASVQPAVYVGREGALDMLAQVPVPILADANSNASARWLVAEAQSLVDAFTSPGEGQVGPVIAAVIHSRHGIMISVAGPRAEAEPEPVPPPPPLTDAERLLHERRTWLHHVDTVAAGVHIARPSYAYYVDLIPAEAKELEAAEARWIAEHGALPYDPDEVTGYPIPVIDPQPQRFTGTFPIPLDEPTNIP